MKKIIVILLLLSGNAFAQFGLPEKWNEANQQVSTQGVDGCYITAYLSTDQYYLMRTGSARLPFLSRADILGTGYRHIGGVGNEVEVVMDILWMPPLAGAPFGMVILVWYRNGLAREIVMLNDTLP